MFIIEAILAFIVLVGILVFVHEMGHFLAARWCGVRTDVFAIGMGPRLVGWNKKTGFSFGKLPADLDLEGDTDYRLSAFPIGGYVKIVGMVDESMDTAFATRPPEPWEFRSKNTFQKAFIISAGVIMNFILAVVVFATLNFTEGKTMAATTQVGYLPDTSPAVAAGLRDGDRITAINGEPVKYFEEIPRAIYINHATDDITLTVERDGAPRTISIPRDKIPEQSLDMPVIPYSKFHYVEIKGVEKETPAAKAGLQPGDVVLRADGERIVAVSELIRHITEHKDRVITLELQRNGQTTFIPVKPNEKGKIGAELSGYNGPIAQLRYGFGEAISSGFNETIAVTTGTFGLVGQLVTGKANLKESVGGPGMIAMVAQQTASRGLTEFMKFLGALSIGLACMNILPIPALDGGHLVFIVIEGVIRREVPLKIRMAIQQVGFALLIIFMAFVLYNDSTRLAHLFWR